MLLKNPPRTRLATDPVARATHDRLRSNRVFTVNIIGSAGCGKTSLIRATLDRLPPTTRTAVITADPDAGKDVDRLFGVARQRIYVETGRIPALQAAQLRQAVDRLNLDAADLLLIENVSSMVGPEQLDLGEDRRVAVFSVAGGDDAPQKHPDVIKWADVIVLSKTDLLPSIPFDLEPFRTAVRRANPHVSVFELSAQTGEGMDAWVSWLRWRSHTLVD